MSKLSWICRYCWHFKPKVTMDLYKYLKEPKKLRENCKKGKCVFVGGDPVEVNPNDRCWNWVSFDKLEDVWKVFGKDDRYPEITDLSPYAKRKRAKSLKLPDRTIQGVVDDRDNKS